MYYWTSLLRIWKVTSKHFPGAHPTSVDTSTMHALLQHPYVVSLKTDGVRFLLFLTRRPDGHPIALMINRSEEMYEVNVWASQAFFDGTVLDGELVWERSGTCMHYLVFDVISLSGAYVAGRAFGERLQLIHSTILVPIRSDISDDEMEQKVRDEEKVTLRQLHPARIVMLPKSCSPKMQALETWMSRSSSFYRNDGLLFTRTDVPMPLGRTPHMLKWKQLHTIDVALVLSDQMMLCQLMGRRGQLLSVESCIDDVTHVNLEKNELVMAGAIVECAITQWCRTTGHLHLYPVRRRLDKNHPNAPSTVESTLQNVEDAFTIDDIMRRLSDPTPLASSKKKPAAAKNVTHARQSVAKRSRRQSRSATSVDATSS